MARTIRHGVRHTDDVAEHGEPEFGERDSGLWARVANLTLGSWLFASGFVLSHPPTSGANAWIVGTLVVIFSLWSLWAPPIRRLNSAAGIWMIASAALLSAPGGSRIHDLLIGFAVVAFSLVPSRPIPTRAYV